MRRHCSFVRLFTLPMPLPPVGCLAIILALAGSAAIDALGLTHTQQQWEFLKLIQS
jgi:hypothetical protein